MDFFIIVIRIPFGILASALLIFWTIIVGAVFCARFAYYAVLGKRRSIEEKALRDFKQHEGTQALPQVWAWVLDPNAGGDP